MTQKQKISIVLLLALCIQILQGYTNIHAASSSDRLVIWYASVKDTGPITEFGSTYDHGKILYAMIDGETAYCLNYAKSANNGQNMVSSNTPITSLTSEQKKYLKYCMYYGFHATNTSEPSESQKNKYIATQAMVWIIEKEVFNTSAANSAAKKLCASAPSSSESYNYYLALKEKMLTALEVKRPSFSASVKTNADTFELKWSRENSRYEVTLSDTNKVLSNYTVSVDGYKVSRNEDKLTFYTKNALTGTSVATLTARNGIVKVTGNCVFWSLPGGNSGYQEFISTVPDSESVLAYLKLKTNPIGYGEIVKKDSSTGNVLGGAVYGIYKDKGCTSLVEKLTTDQKGYAKSSFLNVGTYYVKEIKAPANYVLSSTVYTLTVKADEVTALTVKDKGQKGRLTIYKKGQVLTGWDGMNFVYETGNLPGAEFRVTAGENIYRADGTKKYSKGDIVAKRLVTGVDGSVTLENLELGTYSVAEVKSPDGYKINANEKLVTISYKGQTVEFSSASTSITNARQKAKVKIVKQDSENKKPLAGAEFGFYAATDIKNNSGKIIVSKDVLLETVVTGEDGVAFISKDLPLGYTYYIKEIKPPVGYIINEDRIEVSLTYEGQDISVTSKEVICSNLPITVEFQKIDKNTGKMIEGARLCLLDENETILESWVSQSNKSHVVKGLKIGASYILREESAPHGYLKADDILFTVADTGEVQTITMEDEVPTGTIILNKKGEFLDTADPVIANGNYLSYLFGYVTGSLQGVTFELYADEDIRNVDGTQVFYEKGELVAELVTDETGVASIEGLPLGKYYLTETKTADSYVLDSEPIHFELAYKNQDTEVIYAGIDVENVKEKVKVRIVKSDAETGEHLEGVTFGLYAKDDILNTKNEVILTKDSLIEIAATDQKGVAEFITELPLGSYYVKEIKTVDGYVLSDERFEFVTEYQGGKVDVQEVELELVNYPTKVQITKMDYSGQNVLSGAELSLWNMEGELIEQWVSSKEGHVIERLPVGKYILREEAAPFGYVIAEEIVFEVLDTKELQHIIMKDDLAKGKIRLQKSDGMTGKALKGVEFEVRSADGTVLETLITDENGFAESMDYEIGRYENGEFVEYVKYYLVETKALDGYVLFDEVVEVVFEYVDGTIKCIEYLAEIENVPKVTVPELPKTGDRWGWWWFVGGMIALALECKKMIIKR